MKRSNNNYTLDIVPLTRIPLTRNQSFSYLSETEILPGSLVSIPLFHRKVEGIVLNNRNNFKRFGGIKLKNIEKIIEGNFLTENQIELAKFISEYYISPLGIVIKNFVPKRVTARKINVVAMRLEPSPRRRGGIILTNEQKSAVNEIVKNYSKFNPAIGGTKFLLFGPASSGKTEVYIHSILEIKKNNPALQFLILLPEKTLTPQARERYGAYFKPEEIVILTSNISKGQYYSAWQKIKSGEAKIIIGTRMAIFAPFKKLGLIVIDEEQDISFKNWDMNPRYDARTCAEKLAETYNCPLVRGSATPNIESYYKAINKKYKLLHLPTLKLRESNSQFANRNSEINSKLPITNYQLPAFEIVDMKKERWNKNFSPISKALKSEIAYALKYNQQVILFINRQGMSAFSVCENCKTVLRCPKCDRALIYDRNGIYKCLHCTFETSPIPKCQKCQGISFKNIGLGTQKVEKEIENIFPQARILRADRESTRKSGSQEKIYSDFSQGQADILIGTQMISKGWDLRRVALIGIIDTDNLFSAPDFRNNEKAFQHILQVSGRTSRLGAEFPGKIILQTFHPENKILEFIVKDNIEGFYEKEISERTNLNLPPFSKIIKLVFQDYSLKKTTAETERIYKILEKIPSVKTTEPQDAFISKIRGRFRKQIIIKFPANSAKKPDIKITKILSGLSSGWIVDIDPISII